MYFPFFTLPSPISCKRLHIEKLKNAQIEPLAFSISYLPWERDILFPPKVSLKKIAPILKFTEENKFQIESLHQIRRGKYMDYGT